MQEDVSRRLIAWAEVHELFVDISDYFGFTAEEYADEITDLVELWEKQGYVEIYQLDTDRQYGRAKDSSLAQGASPFYIGLFHVRLIDGENDPLVVLVFEEHKNEDGTIDTVASLRFMLEHEDMFGRLKSSDKSNPEFMRQLRKRIDDFIQEGTNYVPEGK